MSNRKKNPGMTREMEKEAAALVGKHLSPEKRRVLLIVTMIACALPIIMGARLWSQIPALVPSGLIGANGKDDSIPRWMVAFGLPGMMCLLNFLAHFMLQWNQRKQTVPPRASRIVGRWGFPIISVLFCSGMILEAVGDKLSLRFITPCIVGLALTILGAHMWDCPRDAKIALRLHGTEQSETAWRNVHRETGWTWMVVGLVVIAGVMLTSTSTAITAGLVLVALVMPLVYARLQKTR